MKKSNLFLLTLSMLLTVTGCNNNSDHNPDDLELWYKQPASMWVEALPVGNGRLGGMIYGKYDREVIQINEESVWAGSKINNNNPEALSKLPEIQQAIFKSEFRKALELSNKYLLGTPPEVRSYQPLGNLYIDLKLEGKPESYRRSLYLNTGIASTEYTIDGNKITQEVFVSAPQDVMVVSIVSDKPISTDISISRERDTVNLPKDRNGRKRPVLTHYLNEYKNEDGIAFFNGQIVDFDSPRKGPGGKHMRYSAAMKLLKGNEASIPLKSDTSAGFRVNSVKNIVLILTGATDYNIEKMDMDNSIDPFKKCIDKLTEASHLKAGELKKIHIQDHREMFDRVKFSLGEDPNKGIPTDERLNRVKEGGSDDWLIPLYFQYGRYLLMGSSRNPGILPANLQGIWNDQYDAPWNADFHTNINLQMNYWPAEVCNLPETSEILTGFMEKLTVPGTVTAKEMYGANGWTLHHLTDPFGRTGVADGVWGITPMDGPWMTFPVYEHFLFTADTTFLNRVYPMMKGSAEFVLDFLIESPEGYLVTNPSHSPENNFRVPETGEVSALTYAATTDIELVNALFDYCMEAATILDKDREFVSRLADAKKRLPPIEINSKGVIREWIKDYDEPEPGHRHMSHLLGLYPLAQFIPETPELFDAARATIERRLSFGGGHTGWSRAWIVNLFARLHDGEKAYENLMGLLRKSTLTNLFDTHPPFQIDGNFGGTAGIAEMLIQSHNGIIRLLPAIPEAWRTGEVKGLCARGGFVISMKWDEGKLQNAQIYSRKGGKCRIDYDGKQQMINLKKGEERVLTF